jgi:lipopolysaccharide transport system ATP-binding protein
VEIIILLGVLFRLGLYQFVMSDTVIKVENLWKEYRYGVIDHATFKADIQRLLARIRGKTDPNSLIDFNQEQKAENQKIDTFWALRDISLEIKQGEILGVIGKNGAGKSTLLKIMSRVTVPTKGLVKMKGRVACLLEVGTGFHPELTGRENIYLNGAILGMTKAEINSKYDEIFEFSGVGKFIDTPVKRYSSGMHVRLGFAVAAHLDPEILLVDEVLAVGDVAFQKKCLGKMGDIAKAGKTVFFVSHNLGSIDRLCDKVLLLEQGKLISFGETKLVIEKYLQGFCETNDLLPEAFYPQDSNKQLQMLSFRLLDYNGSPSGLLDRTLPFRVAIKYELRISTEDANVEVVLEKIDGTLICHTIDSDMEHGRVIKREPGCYLTTVEFPGYLLNAGKYQVRSWIRKGLAHDEYDDPKTILVFQLLDHDTFATASTHSADERGQRFGLLAPPLKWKIERLK